MKGGVGTGQGAKNSPDADDGDAALIAALEAFKSHRISDSAAVHGSGTNAAAAPEGAAEAPHDGDADGNPQHGGG